MDKRTAILPDSCLHPFRSVFFILKWKVFISATWIASVSAKKIPTTRVKNYNAGNYIRWVEKESFENYVSPRWALSENGWGRKLWRQGESNPWPFDCQSNALANWAMPPLNFKRCKYRGFWLEIKKFIAVIFKSRGDKALRHSKFKRWLSISA